MYKAPSESRQLSMLEDRVRASLKALDRDTRREQTNLVKINDNPVKARCATLETAEHQVKIEFDNKMTKQLKNTVQELQPFLKSFVQKFTQKLSEYAVMYPAFEKLSNALSEKQEEEEAKSQENDGTLRTSCLPCFVTTSKVYPLDFPFTAKKGNACAVINIDPNIHHNFFESFLSQITEELNISVNTVMSLGESMINNHCISTPIVVVCTEFDKFALTYVPFIRMLSGLHKTDGINFIFVFVCEFILPLESLIGAELAQELEVTFCTNGNQFDVLKQFLFNLFSLGTSVRVSAQLLSKLAIHFIMYDNNVNNFVEKICTAIDIHFLDNTSESYTAAVTQQEKECIRSYESFAVAVNLLVIAIDTLSRKGEHSMLDVLLWAARIADDHIPSIIANEIDSSDQILKINELLAVAEKSEIAELARKWIDYLNKFYSKNKSLLANASFILNQGQEKTQKKKFVPLGQQKGRRGVPVIINFIKHSVQQYVEKFEKNEFGQKIIGANKKLWAKLIPSPQELNDSALQQTVPNELQIAFTTLKRLSSRKKSSKGKELKEQINKPEWKEDFVLEMTKHNNESNVQNAFATSVNDLRFMGVIIPNERWNPLWDSVSMRLPKEHKEKKMEEMHPNGEEQRTTENGHEHAARRSRKRKDPPDHEFHKKAKLER